MSYLLANRKAVVCEAAAPSEIDADLRDAVLGVPYDALVDACASLVRDAAAREALEHAGWAAFRHARRGRHPVSRSDGAADLVGTDHACRRAQRARPLSRSAGAMPDQPDLRRCAVRLLVRRPVQSRSTPPRPGSAYTGADDDRRLPARQYPPAVCRDCRCRCAGGPDRNRCLARRCVHLHAWPAEGVQHQRSPRLGRRFLPGPAAA